MYDIVIIGAGPAGLTAAIYGARAGKKVLVIEKDSFGGQIAQSPKVENFPTVKEASGLELTDMMVDQVLALGVDIEMDEVVGVENAPIRVHGASGSMWEAKAVIIATGAKPRRLELDGEDDLIGNGISFCAVCDGSFYAGKTVAVHGGGNSALQEALYLADICETVYLIHRRDSFRGEERLAALLESRENVEFILNSKITAYIQEGGALKGIEVTDNIGIAQTIDLDGLFLAIGHEPQMEVFDALLPLNEGGYADIDEKCEADLPGIFVAGDCRVKGVRQVTTAMSDGATAALAACRFIDTL